MRFKCSLTSQWHGLYQHVTFPQNNRLFYFEFLPSSKKHRVLTAVDPAWLSGYYLLDSEEVFSSFSIFVSLASMLMADMTAPLLTTRRRTQLAPRHHGACRLIVRHTVQVEYSLALMDFMPQHAFTEQYSKVNLWVRRSRPRVIKENCYTVLSN